MKLQGLLFKAAVVSAISNGDPVVHERRFADHTLHRGQRVDGTSITTFRIGLKQSNLEYGYDYLMNVSHPSSEHYGKLWSPEEVRKTFAPSQQSIEHVRNWLGSHGIESITEERGFLSFETTVADAERLFAAQYFEHRDHSADTMRIGCDEYHLPHSISKHVDYITPGVALSPPMEKRSVIGHGGGWHRPHVGTPDRPWRQPIQWHSHGPTPPQATHLPPALQNCGTRISPACIKALYNLPSHEEVARSYGNDPANSLGLFEWGGTYNQSDMDQFFQRFSPYVPIGTHPIPAPVNGAKIQQNGNQGPYTNEETELDLQIIYPLIYPQTVTLYQVSPTGSLDSYNQFPLSVQDFLDALDGSFCDVEPPNEGSDCGIYTPKRVISMSLGVSELIQPEKYVQRLCNEFMKLGLQGTTFTVSSGDYGVASQPGVDPGVQLSNGCVVVGNYNATIAGTRMHNPRGVNGTVFQSDFPATCPYVLSVGATRLYSNETIEDPESVMQFPRQLFEGVEFSSSGGFSNYFSRPSYQDNALSSYFASHDPGYKYYEFNGVDFHDPSNNIGANGGLYNRIGRGLPDVSSNGAKIDVVFYGVKALEQGTSCSAPTWGSIVTLINEKRTQAGKGPVGFINPVLYEHPEVFNDIQKGTNPGCNTIGFPAVEGWDPSTGLGTPNFPKLLDLFLSLP